MVHIGNENLVLESPYGDHLARDERRVVARRQSCRHQHRLCAGTRQTPHIFREFNVVADQYADLHAVEGDDVVRRPFG